MRRRSVGGKRGAAAGRVAQVSELKAGLSAYLERVKRGEQVVITDRGRSIAKLVPIPHPDTPEMERMRGWSAKVASSFTATGAYRRSSGCTSRRRTPRGAC